MKTIYIEKDVVEYEKAKEILARFPRARIIFIDRYTEVFNRRNQDFRFQKEQETPWILAKKTGECVQKNPEFCTSHTENNFYFSTSLNCPFDCEYCFLQGMYQSAFFVLFVNIDDFKIAIQKKIADCNGKAMFFSAYDNDGLAMDAITSFSSDFIPWFEQFPESLLEIRTKSSNISQLQKIKPTQNTIIAFTLSPEEIQQSFEKKTASLQARIEACNTLQELGFTVAIRIEPLLLIENYEEVYGNFFFILETKLLQRTLKNVYFGTFKLPKEFLKKMQKMYPHSKLFHRYFEIGKDGEMTYPKQDEEGMVQFVSEKLQKIFGKEKVFSRLIKN